MEIVQLLSTQDKMVLLQLFAEPRHQKKSRRSDQKQYFCLWVMLPSTFILWPIYCIESDELDVAESIELTDILAFDPDHIAEFETLLVMDKKKREREICWPGPKLDNITRKWD